MTAKKKIFGALGGVAALGATVALTAGTFSYFSDSTSQENKVEFGTLDLSFDEGAEQPFAFDGVAPGEDLVKNRVLSFSNKGDVTGDLRIRFLPNVEEDATAP